MYEIPQEGRVCRIGIRRRCSCWWRQCLCFQHARARQPRLPQKSANAAKKRLLPRLFSPPEVISRRLYLERHSLGERLNAQSERLAIRNVESLS